ncbi:MAG: hypothetical protein KDD94_09315 [Calditrichaeota bacterium]|nr:hypothetical protein [Calditrichota bacterium]
MKSARFILLVVFWQFLTAQQENLAYWKIGIGFGELPLNGSFKPSFSLGYQFNSEFYTGIVYQLKDQISRGETSFNAQSSGLDGLISSHETVAERFMFQFHYSPLKQGPFLSAGFVYNGEDSETMRFNNQDRMIDAELINGPVEIRQTRPAGWGVALGIGLRYKFDNGFTIQTEWTPAWKQFPEPAYGFSSNLTEAAKNKLVKRMNDEFTQNVTNMYKIFQIGFTYDFSRLGESHD